MATFNMRAALADPDALACLQHTFLHNSPFVLNDHPLLEPPEEVRLDIVGGRARESSARGILPFA